MNATLKLSLSVEGLSLSSTIAYDFHHPPEDLDQAIIRATDALRFNLATAVFLTPKRTTTTPPRNETPD